MDTEQMRVADYPVAPIFIQRWSPRAFASEPIGEVDLLSMLEAARWAASSYNSQPWRFVYARRGTTYWSDFLDLLVPKNRLWVRAASAIVVFISKTTMRLPGAEGESPLATHSFDTGTASGYFALQAHIMGWSTHGMIGFDRDRASAVLCVPEGYAVEAIYAVGRSGDRSNLPETLRAREYPSTRLPLGEIAFEGCFRR